ncbi:SMI1/KNR4 family protein [Caballeronia sp. SEWSISQ10-4 2]|uniref:SMI1/KNR4 family protein n=1 Tax=Caballeronia sp. SEWSISQ10-4 2 TaxID=2937438 RepID=UPI00264D93BC|nr:SMI1/KNR4 family protein [Caballeronia sp. SEWSISQ10-4 2]MDN7179300.1 SMI1/KNR4 family protein [Caballeronia sp. SEWSISQ10-4 2]
MKQNEFSKCGHALSASDISAFEGSVAVQLPDAFKAHYLKFNGGMPTLDWFPMKDDWEPIWIHEFLPIAPRDRVPNSASGSTIQSVYASSAGKSGFSKSSVPFAIDPGGNLLCLSLADGSVHYWLHDVFDETLTEAENRRKATRQLTDSFEQFMDLLVTEDDAFS